MEYCKSSTLPTSKISQTKYTKEMIFVRGVWQCQTYNFVRRRLRAILLKRNNKKKCFGRNLNAHKQYPNTYFANLNLFTSNEAGLWHVNPDEETIN